MKTLHILPLLVISSFFYSCIPDYSCSCGVYNIEGGDTLSFSQQYRKVGRKANDKKVERLCREFEAELVYTNKPEKGELDVDCMIYSAK